jgi:hypothetical protein
MFAPNSDAAGVWTGAGVTRTAASATLFVSANAVSKSCGTDARTFFAQQAGFKEARAVRTILFFDYESALHSTAALRAGAAAGFSVDFDKDSAAKRARGTARAREVALRDEAFFCRLCRAPVLFASGGTRLAALPTRGTDGARVLREGDHHAVGDGGGGGGGGGASSAAAAAGGVLPGFVTQTLAKGAAAPIAIRRDGGRVERQFPLLCAGCGVRVGYRVAPLGAPAPFTYVHAGAVTASLRDSIPVDAVLDAAGRAERHAAVKRQRREAWQARQAAIRARRAAEGGATAGADTAEDALADDDAEYEEEEDEEEEDLDDGEGDGGEHVAAAAAVDAEGGAGAEADDFAGGIELHGQATHGDPAPSTLPLDSNASAEEAAAPAPPAGANGVARVGAFSTTTLEERYAKAMARMR